MLAKLQLKVTNSLTSWEDKAMGIEAGTIVQIKGQHEGVVAWDPFEVFRDGEVTVATGEGLHADSIFKETDLQPTGIYEPDIVDPTKCGLGTDNPCNFIGIAGPDDAICTRFTEVGLMLQGRAVKRGQLLPVSLFPLCQNEIQAAGNNTPNQKVLRANEAATKTYEKVDSAVEVGRFSLHQVEYLVLENVPQPDEFKERVIKVVATIAAIAAIASSFIDAFKGKARE